MLYDPYDELKRELINGTGVGVSITAGIINEITTMMQAKAIYHYGNLKIDYIFDSQELEDDKGDLSLIISVPQHDISWESPLEEIYIESKTSREDILQAIQEAIDQVIARYACNLDIELPDKQWAIGIDHVTAEWLLQKQPVPAIRNILSNIGSGGYTFFPDNPHKTATYRAGRVIGGAAITMEGMIATAAIDLGQNVNYRCGIIAMPGLLSETIQQQLIGQDASAIIDHPLMAGAGVIRQVRDNRGEKANDDPVETLVVLERPVVRIDDFIALLDKQDPHKLTELQNIEAFGEMTQ